MYQTNKKGDLKMKQDFNFTQYNILKTFIRGEEINFKIDNISYKSIFENVNRFTLTVINNGKKENIELNKITSITL